MSKRWHAYLQKSFSDWNVQDFAGNNYGMFKDYETTRGVTVCVMVGELFVSVAPHMITEQFITRWNESLENDNDEPLNDFVGLIDWEYEQNWISRKEPCRLFSDETLTELTETMRKFWKEYWIGGGYKPENEEKSEIFNGEATEYENEYTIEYDEYFQGKVILKYTTKETYNNCELWIYSKTSNYIWNVEVVNKKFNDPIELLQELKKEEYVIHGSSVTM